MLKYEVWEYKEEGKPPVLIATFKTQEDAKMYVRLLAGDKRDVRLAKWWTADEKK